MSDRYNKLKKVCLVLKKNKAPKFKKDYIKSAYTA